MLSGGGVRWERSIYGGIAMSEYLKLIAVPPEILRSRLPPTALRIEDVDRYEGVGRPVLCNEKYLK